MTNARRALVATTVVAASLPALPSTASADPIIRCSPTFLIGPVRCAAAAEEERVREENPQVDAILDLVP
jgi:hypothetical protein